METKGLEMNTSVNDDVERQTDRERKRGTKIPVTTGSRSGSLGNRLTADTQVK